MTKRKDSPEKIIAILVMLGCAILLFLAMMSNKDPQGNWIYQ